MRTRRLLTSLAALAALATVTVATSPGASAAAPLPVIYNVVATQNPAPGASPPGANDWSCKPSAAHPRPVVLVHGLLATMGENWGTMSPLLKNNGYCVYALTYGQLPGIPFLGGLAPMEQSSAELASFVDRVLASTGAKKVDLVGHSEGTAMPQYYLKFRGGAAKVDKFVAIAPVYRGTTLDGIGSLVNVAEKVLPAAIAPASQAVAAVCGSCQEFLVDSPFNKHLYADGVYAVRGVTYTTIMTKYDEVVTPYTSGRLDAPNATNIVLQAQCPVDFAEHLAVAYDPTVGQDMLNALDPGHARAVPCQVVLPGFGAPLN